MTGGEAEGAAQGRGEEARGEARAREAGGEARGAAQGVAKRAVKRPRRSARRSGRPKRARTRGAKRPSLAAGEAAEGRRSRSRARPARGRGKPPEPFAAAKAGASAKDLALFEFVRARVAVHAAVQGMAPASAEVPSAPGKWTIRQTLLHLAYWDHEMWRAVEEAFQHNRRPHTSHEEIERINPDAIAALAHLDWESAKRLLQAHRERCSRRCRASPRSPLRCGHAITRWAGSSTLLTAHDRHHAEALREARARREHE